MKKAKSDYDFKKDCRRFSIVMLVAIALIMIAGILDMCGVFGSPEPALKPTESYPMTNTNISWNQSFYPYTER